MNRSAPRTAANSPALVFAGGGTGGHVLPGISVAQAGRRIDPASRFLFLGTDRPAEQALFEEYAFDHLSMGLPVPRRHPRHLASFGKGLVRSVARAGQAIDAFEADAVVGLGGYASLPGLIAGRRRGLPIFLLEQNARLGVTTSWVAPMANRVFCGFADAARQLGSRGVACGNPLRRDLQAHLKKAVPPGESHRPMVLVMGGSQGARAVNRLMVDAAGELAKVERLRLVHLAGPEAGWVEAKYVEAGLRRAEVIPFEPDVGRFLRRADLVISRAGAMAVSEIVAFSRPAIYIPYPWAGGHQADNVARLARAGACLAPSEKDLSGSVLARVVTALLSDRAILQRMALATGRHALPEAAAHVFLEIARQLAG